MMVRYSCRTYIIPKINNGYSCEDVKDLFKLIMKTYIKYIFEDTNWSTNLILK